MSNVMVKNEKAREELRKWLIKNTKCKIQVSNNGKAYPCGTCVIHLLNSIGLNPKVKEYKLHNEKVDRLNEVWRAILQIRDAK
jgi:hypothetical protein